MKPTNENDRGASAVLVRAADERFEYYRLLDRVHRGEGTWQEVADTQDRFDNHYVESAAWTHAHSGDA